MTIKLWDDDKSLQSKSSFPAVAKISLMAKGWAQRTTAMNVTHCMMSHTSRQVQVKVPWIGISVQSVLFEIESNQMQSIRYQNWHSLFSWIIPGQMFHNLFEMSEHFSDFVLTFPRWSLLLLKLLGSESLWIIQPILSQRACMIRPYRSLRFQYGPKVRDAGNLAAKCEKTLEIGVLESHAGDFCPPTFQNQ
jgi:hypothetical protein